MDINLVNEETRKRHHQSRWFIKEFNRKHNKKFNVLQMSYKISFPLSEANKIVITCFKEIIDEIVVEAKKNSGYQEGDRIRIVVRNEEFQHPISTKLSTDVDATSLLEQILEIVTSDQHVDIDKTEFDIQLFKMARSNSENCSLCNQKEHEVNTKNKKYCKKCNRLCYNDDCFRNHANVCSTFYKCKGCNIILERSNNHTCGWTKCQNCKEFVNNKNHQCFMINKTLKGDMCSDDCTCNSKATKKLEGCLFTTKYIWFDYMTQQDTGIHIANLVVAHDFVGNKYTFNTNDDFCNWLISNEHKNFTAIAQNAKNSDAYFILKYCLENNIKPKTIYDDTKLILLELPDFHLRIIDSKNFIQLPLSDFPKTFKLDMLKKKYFPHYFNIPENQNYNGPIPGIEFYDTCKMKPEEKKKFTEWYETQVNENYIFDFNKELNEYCDSNVNVLRLGCLKFRKKFLELLNVDPFQYVSLASVCMAIYRSNYLQKNTIAVLKNNNLQEMYTRGSIAWLNTFENVQHALKGGEKIIFGERVDGFDSNTVYLYHQCFWHGCPKCFTPNTINSVNNETMDDLYYKTSIRNEQILDSGKKLIDIWECDWIKSTEYKNMSNHVEIIEPLNPRDAFYGGRTETIKLRVENKCMKYIDVCSLYSAVWYFDDFPVGHPIKIEKPKSFDPTWYGLIKCKVLPPKNLYHPVLPFRGKFVAYILCKTCLEKKCADCNHTDEQRCITGTWTSVELNKAVEKGYEIKEIYEVWHFENKSSGLFKDYVKNFMKIKLQTSEHNYHNNEEYVKVVAEKLNIKLDIEKIQVNSGKRAIAKLCLNSIWGKFAQRQNLEKTEYITDVEKWNEILLDGKLDILDCFVINENMMEVRYKYKKLFEEDSTSTNILIAIFTTSNARLWLYEKLDKLGESVAYYDTDSVIYIDNNIEIPTGYLLGDWKNELPDDYIIKWSSTGPKRYYYKTLKGTEVLKNRGFSMNYENSQILDHATFDEVVKGSVPTVNLVQYINEITKTKNIVTQRRVNKTFGMNYRTRRIDKNSEEMNTVPWGY